MPFSSGTFSLYTPGNPVVTGTTIASSWAQNTLNDIATGLTTCLLKDGSQTVTANIPMSSFKFTGLAAGSSANDSVRLAQVQAGAMFLLGAVAGTNTITATASPTLTAYASGNVFYFVPAVTNTAATTINIDSLGAKNIFSGGVSLSGGELVASIPVALEYDGTQFNIVASGSMPSMVDPATTDGRLTLTSGTPVTTADVTAAETVYFTPYKGNKLSLYTGSTWKLYTFAELSVDVPDATKVNDVFVYDNAGTLTLDVTAWTDDTTRATALTTQDGVLVKTGATGRKYLGTFYATTAGNGQTEDSAAKRYLWNYYNRAKRQMSVVDTTNTWTYTLAAYQQANNSAANQLDMVIGVSEDIVSAMVFSTFSTDQGTSGLPIGVGIGVDSSTTNSAQTMDLGQGQAVNVRFPVKARYLGFPGIGKHTLRWLEYSVAAGTTTWSGDGGVAANQAGITGEILA